MKGFLNEKNRTKKNFQEGRMVGDILKMFPGGINSFFTEKFIYEKVHPPCMVLIIQIKKKNNQKLHFDNKV